MSLSIGHWVPAYNQRVNANLIPQALTDAMAVSAMGHGYRFWSSHSCDLPALRNQAVQRALDLGLDYLYMQDADVFAMPGASALARMLGTAIESEATLIGAMVTMRVEVERANVWPVQPGEIYECEKIGTGMILIDLGRLRRWYDDYQGPLFARAYATDKQIKPTIGSDIFFSKVVLAHGDKVVCDGRIATVHVDACHQLRYDPTYFGDATGAESGDDQ